MNILKATISDLKTLQELTHLVYQQLKRYDANINPDFVYENNGQYIHEKLRDTTYLYLIAEHQTQAVGYAMGKLEKLPHLPYTRAYLEELFIKDDFQGNGFGTKLIEGFSTWSNEQGAEKITIDALVQNESALRLYKRLKFHPRLMVLEKLL